MPRIKQKAPEYARTDFLRQVGKQSGYYGLNSTRRLSEASGIPYATLRRRMAEPETLTVVEIRKLDNVLHFEEGTVEKFMRG